MPNDDQRILTEAAARHHLSLGAVEAVWRALRLGRGVQAQFSHPDLGGMGQWSRGMVQIGDMFNTSLKLQVAALCADLAERAVDAPEPLPTGKSPQSQLQGSDRVGEGPRAPGRPDAWWPSGLGEPASTGSQNNTRYAMFPEKRRLAVLEAGRMSLYDTAEHLISGFSQQQGGGSSMRFTGQHGPVNLDDLSRIEAAGGSAR